MGADTSWSMGIHRILISDLRGRCIIGVNEEECRNKQDVIINLAILTDLRKADNSDRFEDAVDLSCPQGTDRGQGGGLALLLGGGICGGGASAGQTLGRSRSF